MKFQALRRSAAALMLAAVGWAGCATAPPVPLVDPAIQSGTYAPSRVALLPPDVFVVLDQVGENDPVQSASLGQSVSVETVRAVEQVLRSRGYDVDLSARWDGIVAQDGTVLMSRDELGWLANGILQFANSRDGGSQGTMTGPRFVAPELAGRLGWATNSDALLYVNIKGVSVTSGKRAATVVAAVFIIVIIAAIVLATIAGGKSGNGGGSNAGTHAGGGSAWRGQPVARATAPSGSGFRGAPVSGGRAASMPSGSGAGTTSTTGPLVSGAGGRAAAMPGGNGGAVGGRAAAVPGGHAAPTGGALSAPAAGSGWRGAAPGSATSTAAAPASRGGWRGGGPPPPAGAPVYRGGPNIGVGVAVVVPLDEPVYTHDGTVAHDDEVFAGDELYVSMTMVSTYDGRVLWHARDHLDLEAENPADVDRMVQTFLGSLPPRPGMQPPPPPQPRK